MKKKELLLALVDLLGEESWSEIRCIVDKAIDAQRARLVKLQELSTHLSGNGQGVAVVSEPLALTPEEIEEMSTVDRICWIMKDAGFALGNEEIRGRYAKKFGEPILTSTLGNALWKHKGKKFQKSGGTRFARWKLIHK